MARAARKRASKKSGGSIKVTFADIISARESRAPNFSDLICTYVTQSDPAENKPEEPSNDEYPSLDDDAWTLSKLRDAVAPYSMWGKTSEEAQAARRSSWTSLMAAPYAPPRLKLGDMMIDLYEADDTWSRQSLLKIFANAKMGWGLWKGFKHIFKQAEEKHDAELFGLLASRIDILRNTPNTGEVSSGTALYMRRRAWRYLRLLGNAMPEQYPTFACQVLRHYPRDINFYGTWVASQIWNHEDLKGERGSAWFDGPPDKLSKRAYDEAWKLSAAPLLRLLEDAANDTVCRFVIRSLQADFKDNLRNLDPAWLARIGGKDLPTVDGFVIELLEGNPEFHQSKLKKLGLEEMVIGLLQSSNDKAVGYAIEYCNAHAPTIDLDALLELAERGGTKLNAFVVARLDKAKAKDLGLSRLVRMLGISALAKLAEAKLKSGFKPGDIDEETYVTLVTGERKQREFIAKFYKDAKKPIPTTHLRAHAEETSIGGRELREVMNELGKRSSSEIGVEWIKEALFDRRLESFISRWLGNGMLKGDDLDVDWLKGLVARPSWRNLALLLLGNTELVPPHRIGSKWLLKAARHSDSRVGEFAHSYLLHHFSPGDFALEQGSDDVSVGVDTIFALFGSSGGNEHPAPVRRFAASYLLLHHPELSEQVEGARALGIKPKLKSADYSLARVRPLLFDPRLDVRTFAVKVARAELIRWNAPALAYDLASSSYREARVLGAEAVLGIGEAQGAATLATPIAWLDADRAFAMAESGIKATREISLSLIRTHYQSIGSAAKLSWLMDSPDREVRLFAVRLLWEKHRPLPGPRNKDRQRFDSDDTLREFVRTVLFGLPPGRMERRDGNAVAEKPAPASVAKRQVIEVVRDMAVETGDFAIIVAPVLEEFLLSRAKGEWHSCVAALAQMRAAHPNLTTSLPQSSIPLQESRHSA